MKSSKPRNIDEDIESEIAHSNGDDEFVRYRITIAAQSHDKYRVDNIYSEYSFICPGMKDAKRMKRALYYFDLALFREGRHRHRLLSNTYVPSRRSSEMYTTMIKAYASFSDVVMRLDDDSTIFISGVELTSDSCIIPPTTIPIKRLQVCPEPIDFDLVYCSNCLRIEEKEMQHRDDDTGENHICRVCRERKQKIKSRIPEDRAID